MLDEVHLSAASEALVRKRAGRTEGRLWLPTLSATGTGTATGRIELSSADRAHEVVQKRIGAQKLLIFTDRGKVDAQAMAGRAINLGTDAPPRVAVFLNSREQARRVAVEIASQPKKAERKRRVILLVRERRVYEPEMVARDPAATGFTGDGPVEATAFVVATSAGEVGVDLDADHAVMDLVAFERMRQRLGRVNRRGERVATVGVLPLE